MGHKFCGNCGALLTGAVPTQKVPNHLALRLIEPDGKDGELIPLNQEETIVGRDHGRVQLLKDTSVSPIHAFFTWRGDGLVVHDADSTNGTYLRVREPAILAFGDIIHVGEQFLRFDAPEDFGDLESGLPVYAGTPARAWRYRLTQILPGNRTGSVHCALRASMTIGRSGCDLNFPNDGYLSGEHCLIDRFENRFRLCDNGRRNGSFVRLTQAVTIEAGDQVLVGRQLIRIVAQT